MHPSSKHPRSHFSGGVHDDGSVHGDNRIHEVKVRCVARDLESLPSTYLNVCFARSEYGGGQTTACIGSLLVVHDVAQLADSCTSGTFHFCIPVLAVDH